MKYKKYDPDKYTLLNWKNLTNSDKRDYPDHLGCVNAVLESKDKTVEKPYIVAWAYNQYTYECELSYSFETLWEAYTELYDNHIDQICPFKVVAHSENTACDEESCALFIDSEEIIGRCTFVAIATALDKVNWGIECIEDAL